MVKAIADRRGRILGATIAAAQAGELIQPWCLAIARRLKISALASACRPIRPWARPTSAPPAATSPTPCSARARAVWHGAVPGPAASLVRGGMVSTTTTQPRIVIVGAGFGGLTPPWPGRRAVDVTVVDRRNYHLFQPLLYQVATAGLSPGADRHADPRHPAPRRRTRGAHGQGRRRSTRRRNGACSAIAPSLRLSGGRDRRAARLFRPRRMGRRAGPEEDRRRDRDPPPHPDGLRAGRDRRRCPSIARRCSPSSWSAAGRPASRWRAPSPNWRARRCAATSAASIPPRRASCWSRRARACCRPFPRALRKRRSARSRSSASRCGSGTPVTDATATACTIGDDRLGSRTHSGPPASRRPRREVARRGAGSRRPGHGRADLTCPATPRSSCIGDTAMPLERDGQPVPGVAPVAKQQGAYVARLIRARLAGTPRRAVPLSRLRQPGHDRPQRRRRRFRLAQARRLPGLAAVGLRPHLVPDRLPQPPRGDARLGLVIRDLPVAARA